MVRFNIYMPDDLRYTLRKVALEERTSANQIVLKLIQDYLAKRGGKGK